MLRTQVSLDPTIYRQARHFAKRQGISFAELVRRALSTAISSTKVSEDKPWMRFSGVLHNGATDDSDNDKIDQLTIKP